jgi:hypothetical protein
MMRIVSIRIVLLISSSVVGQFTPCNICGGITFPDLQMGAPYVKGSKNTIKENEMIERANSLFLGARCAYTCSILLNDVL